MWFVAIIGLLIVGGTVCGYAAFARVNKLRADVDRLQEMLAQGGETSARTAVRREVSEPPESRVDATPRPMRNEPLTPPAVPTKSEPSWSDKAAQSLRQNWMIWLGGACVALAGVFLVRYSIEEGLLGPTARIFLALVFGVSFHGVAEWSRRRAGATHPAMSALAGAGSITLYAALLSALRLYNLITPGTAFASMAVVALGTMVMARLHGPLLAAFGIIGAFLVPIVVSTGDGEIRILLIYALTVSASALLLMRYVYRPWLWWGFAIGALFWGYAALGGANTGASVTLYFSALAYLVSALPHFDWTLRRESAVPAVSYRPATLLQLAEKEDRHRVLFYGLLTVLVAMTILAHPDTASPWLVGLPFFVVTLFLARRQDQLYWLPWVTLLTSSAAWLVARLDLIAQTPLIERLPVEHQVTFLSYLGAHAAVAAGLSLWNLSVTKRPAVWASLATLAPVVLLTLAYLLVTRPEVNWNWGLATMMFASVYLAMAKAALRKLSSDSLTVWLFIGGHFALALACAMVFEAASLTLALAAQFVSLAWVIRTLKLPSLGWLLKVVVAVVLTRLTLNPWLPDYPTDVHWSLWTYGGSTLLAVGGAYLLRPHAQLSKWVSGAALHLLVLTLWTELRYQLYGGNVYAAEYSFQEAVLSMLLFASLALVYHVRAGLSTTLGRYLRAYSTVLLALATLIYAAILIQTQYSGRWLYEGIGQTPLLNMATVAFGAPVVFGLLFARFYDAAYRRRFLMFSGVSAFVFISLEIRHLWTGNVRLDAPGFSGGELYTYSAVWLALAIATVLAGTWRLGQDVYRAGMILLALVIAKLFFLDMAGLEGLFRVASFMGLGLSLLGISFLHQKLAAR